RGCVARETRWLGPHTQILYPPQRKGAARQKNSCRGTDDRRLSSNQAGRGRGLELKSQSKLHFSRIFDRAAASPERPICRASIGSGKDMSIRSEEHTSELQSRGHLVCRLLLEKKKPVRTQAL